MSGLPKKSILCNFLEKSVRNSTRPDPQIFRSIFGHVGPSQPLQQLRLTIPCRGSQSKPHFGPREAPSGPKPYFWDVLVSAPRRISRRCEGFQALRPTFRRCARFSGAVEDFQALRRISCSPIRTMQATHVLRGWRTFLFLFPGKMHVLEKK